MGPIEWMETLSNSHGQPYNCIGMLVRPVLSTVSGRGLTSYEHWPSFTTVLLNRDQVQKSQEGEELRIEAVAILGDQAHGILVQAHEYRVIWDDGKFV